MTASNIVRFETEDGRTVSTAAGSPLHREYLARLEAEGDAGALSSDETNSDETGVSTQESVEIVPPSSTEAHSTSSESAAPETSQSGRGRKVPKTAAERLGADDSVS